MCSKRPRAARGSSARARALEDKREPTQSGSFVSFCDEFYPLLSSAPPSTQFRQESFYCHVLLCSVHVQDIPVSPRRGRNVPSRARCEAPDSKARKWIDKSKVEHNHMVYNSKFPSFARQKFRQALSARTASCRVASTRFMRRKALMKP